MWRICYSVWILKREGEGLIVGAGKGEGNSWRKGE